ncbi:DamX protein [Photobacterium aphoticum]|uniref:DamX protein n=1 Tax=Photobacterium aphoticum TaxID=754436 RepID=A0A090QVH9_9GAMM|nr:DamX protein [Photobacterium aphoticum]
MRTGASPYSLDLDSQIQLLSRLQFLTRFSSHLIQVTGPQGAGKTWLSQRYLEQWAGVPQQALLLCHPQQTDAQHRRFLLQQIAPKAVFNEQDPIVDSMERIFAHFAVNMVIVVDEAHHLSPAVVAELWHWYNRPASHQTGKSAYCCLATVGAWRHISIKSLTVRSNARWKWKLPR